MLLQLARKRISLEVNKCLITVLLLKFPQFALRLFLDKIAKLRKATISFDMSVCPSVRMEKLGSHKMNLDETLTFELFLENGSRKCKF
jgi:hypothetical protein